MTFPGACDLKMGDKKQSLMLFRPTGSHHNLQIGNYIPHNLILSFGAVLKTDLSDAAAK